MSSQLHSGFVWVQAVAHLLLPWFRVTSFVQSRFVAKDELGYKLNSFYDGIFLPKRGWNSDIFMYYYMNSEKLHAL